MERALRQTVVIGPGGRFEGKAPELVPGTTAEIIVLFSEETGSTPERAKVPDVDWSKHWAASDRLIAEGMETWDLDQVNAEVHARRYGDRERY